MPFPPPLSPEEDVLVVAVSFVGFVVLLFDTNRFTFRELLLGLGIDSKLKARRTKEAEERLDRMTTQIWKADYIKALESAREIGRGYLGKIDEIDFLYLKCFASIKVLSTYTPHPSNQTVKGEEMSTSVGDLSEEERAFIKSESYKDLDDLLEAAPRMAESLYLLGYLCTLDGEFGDALENITIAEKSLHSTDLNLTYTKREPIG